MLVRKDIANVRLPQTVLRFLIRSTKPRPRQPPLRLLREEGAQGEHAHAHGQAAADRLQRGPGVLLSECGAPTVELQEAVLRRGMLNIIKNTNKPKEEKMYCS